MEVKEAADRAVKYLTDLLPEIDKIQLEEIELTEGNHWYITLSYESYETGASGFGFTKSRKFKVFKIDAADGKVLSMKIREIK